MDLSQAEKYFQKYYDRLIGQTIDALAHLELWKRLENYKASYLDELSQAPHFFTFTIRAHIDDTLITLSRILDSRRRGDPLNIWKFLDFTEQNCEIFSNQAFSQRMRGKSEHYEYQVKSHRPITQKEIEEDRQKLKGLKQTIDNLITWRDKVLAHVDRKFLLTGKIVSREYPLQRQQLEEVIDTLLEILNRYSYAFKSSTYLEKIPGEDDVQYVMDCIRFYIEEQNRQIEEYLKDRHMMKDKY